MCIRDRSQHGHRRGNARHILQRQLRRESQHPRTQRGVLFCRERIRHIQPEASRQRQALQRGDVYKRQPLDLTSTDYEQTITVTKQEVAEDIAAAFPDIVLEGDAAGWLSLIHI